MVFRQRRELLILGEYWHPFRVELVVADEQAYGPWVARAHEPVDPISFLDHPGLVMYRLFPLIGPKEAVLGHIMVVDRFHSDG